MVFFQAMLLGGYAYAHFIARYIPLKIQAIVHLGLLSLFTMVLPLTIPPDAIPPEDSGQAWWQLCTMLTCIGGPFFVLAASAPLFQHWFASSGHPDAENPYYLYAISNIGSMAALLGYPTIIEPFLSLSQQTGAWMYGYLLLIAVTFVCAALVRNGVKPVEPLASLRDRETVSWKLRAFWILLAFIPSSLMLGVTTLITTDLASAPFLWVIPLAIYLATFIIAFSKKPLLSMPVLRLLTCYALCIVLLMLVLSGFLAVKLIMIAVHLGTFFLCGLLCHGQLAESKPSTSHLTEFFLLISFGGVLGGIFNALIAPVIFVIPLEYILTLSIVPFIIWFGSYIPSITGNFNKIDHSSRPKKLFAIDVVSVSLVVGLCALVVFAENSIVQIWSALAIFCVLMVLRRNIAVFSISILISFLILAPAIWGGNQKTLHADRNYFGVLRVATKNGANFFSHGTTLHGAQFQKSEWKLSPITYYNPQGPVADIFKEMDKRGGKQSIGVLGLGVGSVACYKKQGRSFDFYEIDTDVVRIAEDPQYFTYLKDCGSPYKIIVGDARLKMLDAPTGGYDLLFIDTFSSDNIPVHIMTEEAFRSYLGKMKPNGLIAMNISNRYLNLRPVLTSIAKDLGLTIYFKYSTPKINVNDQSALYTASLFAIIGHDEQDVAAFVENHDWKPYTGGKTLKPWTDDYANILTSLNIFQ